MHTKFAALSQITRLRWQCKRQCLWHRSDLSSSWRHILVSAKEISERHNFFLTRLYHSKKEDAIDKDVDNGKIKNNNDDDDDDTILSTLTSRMQIGELAHDEQQLILAGQLDALLKELRKTDVKVIPQKELSIPMNFSYIFARLRRSIPTFEALRTMDKQSKTAVIHSLAVSSNMLVERLLYSFQQFSLRLKTTIGYTKFTPKGLYIYGSVGVGKSLLMDIFHEKTINNILEKKASLLSTSSPSFKSLPRPSFSNRRCRRVHFHEFMLEVHSKIHTHKQKYPRSDPIPPVALELAQNARILCFDEFQVTDIADAMILRRLFEYFWKYNLGVVVIATSNRPPSSLYEGGLNRNLFLPFIDTLKENCHVVKLHGTHDYRRQKNQPKEDADDGNLCDEEKSFFCPSTPDVLQRVDEQIFQRNGGSDQKSKTLTVLMGRTIFIPKSNQTCAWMDFDSLCKQPLGAADYLAICRHFPTLIIDAVPQLGADHINEARRFVTLIDAVYESRTRLVLVSDVPMEQIFEAFDAETAAKISMDGDEQLELDEHTFVLGEGGSSSSMATTMIQSSKGPIEWSATGRIGASLAQLSGVKDVAFSFERAKSRLHEINGKEWMVKKK